MGTDPTPTALPVEPGELVAVLVPPGPAWAAIAGRLWEARVPFVPVDDRLPRRMAEELMDRLRPSAVLGPDGTWERRSDGIPLDPEVAFVVMTSGTTGDQRAVVLERGAVEAAVAASTAALDADASDGWICPLPLAHVGGLNVLMRATIAGTPLAVTAGFDTDALDGLIATGQYAFTSLVPTTLARCLDAGVDLARLTAVLVGGAALSPELAERARRDGVRIVTTYGLTETCGGVVYDGHPFRGTDVRLDERRRILVRGPTLMRGYLRDATATAEVLSDRGWLRTGDIGDMGDGRLAVLGRADDAITTGGELVMPEPVEHEIHRDPHVSDVAVVGLPDDEWGQRVVAFVIPRDPASPPVLEELRDLVASRLPRYAAPRELVIVDRLPRTPSGKLRRRALVETRPTHGAGGPGGNIGA